MSRRPRSVPSGLRPAAVRRQLSWLLTAAALTLVLVAPAPLFAIASDGRIPVMDLMSDPAEVEPFPWYVGAVSDLNLFVWAAATAMYLLAAFGLRRAEPGLAATMAALSALTVVFALDDRFLLHEIVYPWLFGVPELVTFGVYAAFLAVILVVYRRVLLAQPEVVILLLGLVGLGLSLLLDAVGWDSTLRRAAEETAKMLGAIAWMIFPAAILLRRLDPDRPR